MLSWLKISLSLPFSPSGIILRLLADHWLCYFSSTILILYAVTILWLVSETSVILLALSIQSCWSPGLLQESAKSPYIHPLLFTQTATAIQGAITGCIRIAVTSKLVSLSPVSSLCPILHIAARMLFGRFTSDLPFSCFKTQTPHPDVQCWSLPGPSLAPWSQAATYSMLQPCHTFRWVPQVPGSLRVFWDLSPQPHTEKPQ